jgi:putative membrane protein
MPHMWDNGWWFWGMHMFWWIFWVILIILLVSLVMPRQRRSVQSHRETPLGVLQRRYAAGEISTEEYEDRKARLERDRAK